MSVLTLSLLLVGISTTLACDCVKYAEFKTIQQQYCEADFGMHSMINYIFQYSLFKGRLVLNSKQICKVL